MKKRKLKARLECSNQLLRNAGEQNNVLTNTIAALRRELSSLQCVVEGAVRRNTELTEQLALAHEAYKSLEVARDAALIRADTTEKLLSRMQRILETGE